MARLSSDDYLRHLRTESARFREVLTDADPGAAVPGCPDWTAADLLWHLTGVQRFWARIIRDRPAGPVEDEPERPASYDAMLTAYDEHSASLAAALADADPTEPAWSWSDVQTVGFTFRRQAHEALIHRLDAEQTVGSVTPLDPVLAADGVDEVLDVMYGGTPPWGTFTPLPRHVRVEVDGADPVWVQLGRFRGTDPESGVEYDLDDITVVPPPGVDADVVVSAPAGPLDAWLWRRGDATEVRVTGDREVYDLFRSCVEQPIN